LRPQLFSAPARRTHSTRLVREVASLWQSRTDVGGDSHRMRSGLRRPAARGRAALL